MIKKKWYVFALVSIIVALFCMVMFNYTALSSNITQSIEDVGSSNLAQAKEELQAYLENGKSVVQTTAVSVEYMVDAGAKAEDIKQFLVYESKRYMEEIDENFSGIYGLFDGTYIDGIGWVPDADYDPKMLLPFLRSSQHYTLEKVMNQRKTLTVICTLACIRFSKLFFRLMKFVLKET